MTSDSVCAICNGTIETTQHQLRSLDEAATSVRACGSCGPVVVPINKFLAMMSDPSTRTMRIEVPAAPRWNYNLGDIVLRGRRQVSGRGIDSRGEHQEEARITNYARLREPGGTRHVLRIEGKSLKYLVRASAFRVGTREFFRSSGRIVVSDIQPQLLDGRSVETHCLTSASESGRSAPAYEQRQERLVGHAGRDMRYVCLNFETQGAPPYLTRNRTQNLDPLLMLTESVQSGPVSAVSRFHSLKEGTPLRMELEIRDRECGRSTRHISDQSHRDIMTWIANMTGMGAPRARDVRSVLSEVDPMRRLVMDYLNHFVVVITTTSYLVTPLAEVGRVGLKLAMGNSGNGQWLARRSGGGGGGDGNGRPLVVLCDRMRVSASSNRSIRGYAYMITAVLTDTSGHILPATYTSVQCREVAKDVASRMGSRWGYSSDLESVLSEVSVPETGFASLVNGRPRDLPKSRGKPFASYIMERMSAELVVLASSAPYVLLLDGPAISTPHMAMLYARMCVVQLDGPSIRVSIRKAVGERSIRTEDIPDECADTIDLPGYGLYEGPQCICGIITAEGMNDRRARLIMDTTCGRSQTNLHRLVRSSLCLSDTPKGCDDSLVWTSVRVSGVVDIAEVCPEGKVGPYEADDLWLCARGVFRTILSRCLL